MLVHIIIALAYVVISAPLDPSDNYHDLDCQTNASVEETQCTLTQNIEY